MQVTKSMLLLLGGSFAGIAFMLSCGDNWHLSSDAAIDAPTPNDAALGCDCPAAEPPLAHRLAWSSVYTDIHANAQHYSTLFCPVGLRPIGGGCSVVNAPANHGVTLKQSGFYDDPPTGWRCSYRNEDPVMYLGKIFILCIAPAP